MGCGGGRAPALRFAVRDRAVFFSARGDGEGIFLELLDVEAADLAVLVALEAHHGGRHRSVDATERALLRERDRFALRIERHARRLVLGAALALVVGLE